MGTSLADVQQELAIADSPAERFQELSRDRQREVFFQLPETIQRTLVTDMEAGQLQQFVRRLDPDEATDVLGLASQEIQSTVLQRLDDDRREKVEYLLGFSPESAAGLMHLDYLTSSHGFSRGIPPRG